MTRIYHLTTPELWQAAQTAGEYTHPSLVHKGFIHAANLYQVLKVAERFYRELPEVLLLVIERARLAPPIKDEPPEHPAPVNTKDPARETYPHIYGALNLDAVTAVLLMTKDERGLFVLPDGV